MAFVCTSEDMHPYECDGPGNCRYCDDEADLRYDLEQAERRLASMESGGPHRITNEPEWNRAVRRQRDKVRDLRGELAEMEGDDSPEART